MPKPSRDWCNGQHLSLLDSIDKWHREMQVIADIRGKRIRNCQLLRKQAMEKARAILSPAQTNHDDTSIDDALG